MGFFKASLTDPQRFKSLASVKLPLKTPISGDPASQPGGVGDPQPQEDGQQGGRGGDHLPVPLLLRGQLRRGLRGYSGQKGTMELSDLLSF